MAKKKTRATMAMIRDNFFKGERPQLFVGVPRFSIKKGTKMLRIPFMVPMKAALVQACDEKLQRAYEDCAAVTREIDEVKLRVRVPNTDVDFFELVDLAEPAFQLPNVELEGFLMARGSAGDIFLSFAVEVPLLKIKGAGAFAQERFGTALWAAFVPSQFALGGEVSL